MAAHCCDSVFFLAAAANILQGDTYLQPNELLGLQRGHVIKPSASRRQDMWGVVVASFEGAELTKTVEFDD